MKNKLFFTLLSILFIGMTSCKKVIQKPNNEPYDEVNKIFRVKVSSPDGISYKVVIRRVLNSNTDAPIDEILAQQETGKAFEYGFSPNKGELIIVTVTSSNQNIGAYAYYKGLDMWRIDLKADSPGYSGTFQYVAKE